MREYYIVKYTGKCINPSKIMKRKKGYYWVYTSGSWIIAEWEYCYWTVTGANESVYSDDDFDLIDETPIEKK